MKKVYEIKGYSIYKYKPRLFKPFYISLEPLSIPRRIRFLLAYFSGFEVYYIKRSNEYVGYCVVQRGNDRRYTFATESDILTGPAFVKEEYRGKGLYPMFLSFLLNKSGIKYDNAYSYKRKDNYSSIRVSEKLGYKYVFDANITPFLRRIKICEKGLGDFVIYRYKNNWII